LASDSQTDNGGSKCGSPGVRRRAGAIFGRRVYDVVVCLVLGALLLWLTCPRLLVYFRRTVAVISYEGITADGRPVRWVPQTKEFRLFGGGGPRSVVIRSAERRAKRYAARLAAEPSVIESGVTEVQWTLKAGPHSEKPVVWRSGVVPVGSGFRESVLSP